MRRLVFLLAIVVFACIGIQAQKIEKSYWGCVLGDTYQQVLQTLRETGLEPISTDDAIYLKDNDIFQVRFATIGMKFTAEDAFYNIFGYNKYTSKQDATNGFNMALDQVRSIYPNVQPMGKPEGCLKLYAYTDDGHENVFSLGLYKGNGGVFFVRLNIYSDYLLKRVTEK